MQHCMSTGFLAEEAYSGRHDHSTGRAFHIANAGVRRAPFAIRHTACFYYCCSYASE